MVRKTANLLDGFSPDRVMSVDEVYKELGLEKSEYTFILDESILDSNYIVSPDEKLIIMPSTLGRAKGLPPIDNNLKRQRAVEVLKNFFGGNRGDLLKYDAKKDKWV